MIFWKKTKTLELRCYPFESQLPDLFPIELSKKVIPQWYKDLIPYKNVNAGRLMPTTKMCPGMKHFFDMGVTIPLWHDYKISQMENGNISSVETPLNKRVWEMHQPEQWSGAFPGWEHIKLLNPWFIETDRPVQFVSMAPTWHQKNPAEYIIAPGALEFKYQHGCHVQMFLPPTNGVGRTINLEAGTPILHLVPTEEVDLKITFCEMDQRAHSKLVEKYVWTWENLYRKTRNIKESKNATH